MSLGVVAFVAAIIFGVLSVVHSYWRITWVGGLALDVVLVYAILSGGSFLRYSLAPGKTPCARWLPPGVSLWRLVMDPQSFWRNLRAIALAEGSGGAAIFQLLGTRGVLCVDRSMIRCTAKDDVHFKHYAHPNARWLFYTTTSNQLITMTRDLHTSVRAQLHSFLSTTALVNGPAVDRIWSAAATYVESAFRANGGKSVDVDFRVWTQALLAYTMLVNVYGGYARGEQLDQGVSVWDVCADVQTFTMGFLSLPIPYRPFGLGRAIAAGERIISLLQRWMRAVRNRRESEEDVKEEKPPVNDAGFLGAWMTEIARDDKIRGILTDRDVAINVLDMVFAAQDATNSALCFAAGYLASQPAAMAELRKAFNLSGLSPQEKARRAAEDPLLHNFVVNLLGIMPPVPMTLRRAVKPFILKGDTPGPPVHILPGDIIVQSIESLSDVHDVATPDFPPHQLFSEPPDPNFAHNVVFGTGRHKCPGKYYAILTVKVIVAVLVTHLDLIPVDYNPCLVYYPTLFPTKSTFRLVKLGVAED